MDLSLPHILTPVQYIDNRLTNMKNIYLDKMENILNNAYIPRGKGISMSFLLMPIMQVTRLQEGPNIESLHIVIVLLYYGIQTCKIPSSCQHLEVSLQNLGLQQN